LDELSFFRFRREGTWANDREIELGFPCKAETHDVMVIFQKTRYPLSTLPAYWAANRGGPLRYRGTHALDRFVGGQHRVREKLIVDYRRLVAVTP
jgi:hypothetical protein